MSKLKKRSVESEDSSGEFNEAKPDWQYIVSTGSTLLDLAISGKRIPKGGIPSGILVEIAGSSGSGKCLNKNSILSSDWGFSTVEEYFNFHGIPLLPEEKDKEVIFHACNGREFAAILNGIGEMVSPIALTCNGERDLYRVTLENGLEHEVTANHPFLTERKVFVETKDLTSADYLEVPLRFLKNGAFPGNGAVFNHFNYSDSVEKDIPPFGFRRDPESVRNFLSSFLTAFPDEEWIKAANFKKSYLQMVQVMFFSVGMLSSLCEENGKFFLKDVKFTPEKKILSRVVSVEKIGKEMTYDVSMPGSPTFVLNGCVSHNTAVLTEIGARVQKKGGEVFFCDPEDRLDKEYAQITGLNIRNQGRYERPDTVTELFDFYNSWETDPSVMNVFCGDSLAALSTKMEMEEGDKMGMRRAKEFSEQLRKTCRTFKKKNVLMVCSNQIRDGGPNGTKTIPGGNAVPFYSTVRMRVEAAYPNGKIKKEKTIRGAKQAKVIGIQSMVTITKNSLDDPFRKVPISIIFGYGLDDIRANLTWYKEATNAKKFILPGNIEIATIDRAIEKIEEENLAKKLRFEVRALWMEIEESFKQNRKPKEF